MKRKLSPYLIILAVVLLVVVIFLIAKANYDGGSSSDDSSPENQSNNEIINEQFCMSMADASKKDDCWADLAEQSSYLEEDEQKAAQICARISDEEKHESCLDNVAYEFVSTCELMRTKDENPSEWYNECIYFVAEDIATCKLIKNDLALTNDCIYFVSETVDSCMQIENDETLTDTCISDVAKTEADCEKIKSERIREECKINVLMNEEE